MTKQFVHEAVSEALKLECALARLRADKRIVLLHYSPIQATVVGEPAEIFPFLGSSRLEEPLDRYSVTAVFHGHAHRGSPEGRTKSDVPVYNVAMKLLQNTLAETNRASGFSSFPTARASCRKIRHQSQLRVLSMHFTEMC